MEQMAFYIVLIVLVFVLVFVLDYLWTSKGLRELNKKISENKDFLKDKDKRALCNTILNQTYIWGIFSLIEARKLKKFLDKV